MGTSKGCKTCRKRKVRCDLGKPTCGTCARSNRDCGGYMHEFKWNPDGQVLSQRVPTRRQQDEAPLTVVPSDAKPEMEHGAPVTMLTSSLDTSLTDDNLFAYLAEAMFREPVNTHSAFGWRSLISLQYASGYGSVPYTACKSVALAYFGRKNSSSRLLRLADVAYGRALSGVADLLRDPQTCFESTSLEAVMLLYHYETAMYTSGRSWITHAGGIGGLIESRGPHRHVEYPEHGYFLLSRSAIVVGAIVTRKSTFLDRPEWKTIPWSKHPETKSAAHRLMDSQAALPGILADYRNFALSSNIENSQDVVVDLVRRVEVLMRESILWRWDLEASYPYICTEVPPDKDRSYILKPDGTPLYLTVFSFIDLPAVYTINLYHSVVSWHLYAAQMLGVPNLWSQTYNTLLQTHTAPLPRNPLPFPSADQEMLPLVDAIARSVDYYLQPGHPQITRIYLLWPQRSMALGFTGANEIEKAEWAVSFGKRLVAEGGPGL